MLGSRSDRSCACLPACKLPAWNDSQKQRRSFVFQPSDCSNRPALSSPRLLATVGFSLGISYGSSWLQNLFFFLLPVLFLLQFLDDNCTIFPREKLKCLSVCSHLWYMYATGLEWTDIESVTLHTVYILRCVLEWIWVESTSEQQISFLGGFTPGDQTDCIVPGDFSSGKVTRLFLFCPRITWHC